MKIIGIALWAGGIFLVAYAMFVFDTSVSYARYDRVVNLDLQQQQLVMTIMGGLMFLTGVVLHALATMIPVKREADAQHGPQQDAERLSTTCRRSLTTLTDDEVAAQKDSARLFAASLGESLRKLRD